ncbi:MAG: Flp pilus assembly complex ATPase component TadA [Hyphomonadaceae bacterium]|nr:Flp pilus assembly complex ATPase component TadA [Clostridia bacterium]
MPRARRKRLGDLLLEAGLITELQLMQALAVQKQMGKKLGEVLTSLNFVTQSDIIKILEAQLGIPYIYLPETSIDASATAMISESLAKRHELIPIMIDNGKLIVAMSDPLNIFAIDDVRIYSNMEVSPAIADAVYINRAIDIYYGEQKAKQAADEFKKEYGITAQDKESDEEDIVINTAPIVKLLNSVLEQAIHTKTSDIHIEPMEDHIRIRYRRNGELEEIMRHDLQLLPAIVTRIKISADLNIAEKRRPQDGRFSITLNGDRYDFRVSILPTVLGEKVVMRISNKKDLLKPKEKIFSFKDDLAKLDDILKSPHGMILVTGPTGSGKSTTLYTVISEKNKSDVNIITVEDPVEVILEGINQVQVNTKAGVDFATTLRTFLRQDPDVIVVGEIRDGETAEIAISAAVTGHLVISTLHTNDAPGTISRLMDMNIEPFLIGVSLNGVISQRLVKRLCPQCRQVYKPTESELSMVELPASSDVPLYHHKGCKACNNSGYAGRMGVFEILTVNPAVRNLINKRASSDDIRDEAIKWGMKTLKMNCIRLVIEGHTTIEELVRVAYSNE